MRKAQRVSRVLRGVVFLLPALVACESKSPAPMSSPTASTVMPMSTGSANSVPTVEVTNEGFQPSRVALGADRRVVFRRVADGTCATAVVFPSLGIQKVLPLNADVAIELPRDSHGELGFQCGMGMYRGKVVAE